MFLGASKKSSDWIWECQWAPHDEPTYRMVFEYVRPDDVIFEIGAGDFRLSRRLATKSRFVYGLEMNPALVTLARAEPKIDNLCIILGDAYFYPFPKDITVAVLMMRHCQRFRLLAEKLAGAGCIRLITNARWGMGVELVDLSASRLPFRVLNIGWYACQCGVVGFVEGSARLLTADIEAQVVEVSDCPSCVKVGSKGTLDRTPTHT